MISALPYPVQVMDNFLPSEFFDKVTKNFQPLKKYHAYDDKNARKITSVPGGVTGAMKDALEVMAASGEKWIPDAEPDRTFYGAGVSIMRPGDFLKPHIDHATHPHTGKTRMHNFLLYLTDCEGGELRLIGPDSELKIRPKRNRAVIFQSHGNAVHAVEPVISGERIALSVYFYSDKYRQERSNAKAEFL